MKFEGTRKSAGDHDVNVYIVALGRQELILLKALVDSALRYTPRVLETTSTCGRLRNFAKTLDEIIKA